MKRYILLVGILACLGSAKAQFGKDSTLTVKYKNTLRMNLTNSVFFGNGNLVFGYERVVSPHQSFSVNLGLAAFPKLGSISFDSIQFTKESKGSGFNLAADYRFYLKKENKHNAPHGLYIGPYFTFNQMNRTNHLKMDFTNGGSVDFDLSNKLTLTALGFELGYQFLFYHDRIALDIITIGPSYGFYKYEGKLTTNLDAESQKRLARAIEDYIQQKYPGASQIFKDNVFSLSDASFTSMYGYRMVIHLGYRF